MLALLIGNPETQGGACAATPHDIYSPDHKLLVDRTTKGFVAMANGLPAYIVRLYSESYHRTGRGFEAGTMMPAGLCWRVVTMHAALFPESAQRRGGWVARGD